MVRVGGLTLAAAGLAVILFGCAVRSGGIPGRGTEAPQEDTWQGAWADSVDGLENILAEAGTALSAEEFELAAQEVQAEAAAADMTGGAFPGPKGPWFKLENVSGYRQVLRAETGLGKTLNLGFRRSDGRCNAFAQLRGVGPLENLVVGGIRPRLGEGLLLGARYSPFTVPRTVRLDAGLTVSPTASVWSRQRGAAGLLRLGSLDVAAAGWRDDTASARACWGSISRRFVGGVVGIAAGRSETADSRGDSPDAVDVVVFGGADTPAGNLSGECARFGGSFFTAVRSTVRGSGDWVFELFNGAIPSGFSNTVVCPSDLDSRQWGGAAHRIQKLGGVRTRISAYSNRRRSGAERRYGRRLELAAGARLWEASARLVEEKTTKYPKQAVEPGQTTETSRRGLFKAGWNSSDAGFLQFYRVQLLTGGRGADALGAVGGVGLGFAAKTAEFRFQVNNYHLAPGQQGYLTRPGVAGYETVSAVTGRGSDLSARLRVFLAGRVTLALYWGNPWNKPTRWFATVKTVL